MPTGTPMWHAIKNNRPEVVKLLLERGAKHIPDTICPVYRAIVDERIDILDILMDYRYMPSDVYYPELDGQHMIHVAARAGNVNIVKMLLAYGADPNDSRTTNGWAPLMYAADKGNIDAMKVLLDAGAKMHMKSNDDKKELKPYMRLKSEYLHQLIRYYVDKYEPSP